MQQRISSRLGTKVRLMPEVFAQPGSLEKLASDAYLELGQGEFGRFSEAFRVPQDVDVDGIDACYKDGVLQVVLPKRISVRSMGSAGLGSVPRTSFASSRYPGVARH